MPKIAIIGAGSLVFSSRMVADICTYDALKDTHFALVDVNPERLAYAERITRRIIDESGRTGATLSASQHRRDVLEGCDYVITSILVGGYEAIELEIDIPMKYGVDQCIGDTLTPGGILRCLRTLPHQAGICRDVMELCPRAQVLNYTNPMGMLCSGMVRAAPGVRLVGLCHSVQGTHREWAKRLGVEVEELDFLCAGINHQAWMTKLEHKGVDMLPRARELATDPTIWLGDTTRMELTKHFGLPPTESSGHNSEYNPWFRKRPELIEHYCRGDEKSWNGKSGYIKRLYSRKDWRETMEAMASGERPVTLERSMEYGSRIIHAMETGMPEVIYGNVPNEGLIDNLPQGACVEVPCLVDRNGVQPTRVGNLPEVQAAINRTQLNVQELAVQATLETDPEKVFQAMCMDPLTGAVCSLDEIRAMTIELLEAHRPWLPAFEGKALKARPVLVGCQPEKSEKHVDPGVDG